MIEATKVFCLYLATTERSGHQSVERDDDVALQKLEANYEQCVQKELSRTKLSTSPTVEYKILCSVPQKICFTVVGRVAVGP